MFDYIEENLQKIKTPYKVNVIKPASMHGKGKAMWAWLNNGEPVQITKSQGVMTFPWQPIYCLAKDKLARTYFKSFGTIDTTISINKNHLRALYYVDTNKIRVTTYACFDDGQTVELQHPLKNYFFKQLKSQMEQTFGMRVECLTEEQESKLNQ